MTWDERLVLHRLQDRLRTAGDVPALWQDRHPPTVSETLGRAEVKCTGRFRRGRVAPCKQETTGESWLQMPDQGGRRDR